MTDRQEFSIVFDGEALRDHRMDVRDLGPALMSLGGLFDSANRVINGDQAVVKVHVKANESGSFEVVLEACQGLGTQIVNALTGNTVVSVLHLATIIGLIGGKPINLFGLLKWLRGKLPKKPTQVENGNIRIELDGMTIEVPLGTWNLYLDLNVRQEIRNVLAPLEKEGIEEFKVKNKGRVVETVTKSELEFFKVPEMEDEKITEEIQKKAFTIISLTFKEGNKWRLHDGTGVINVVIKDQEFLKEVNSSLKSFSKGDILKCELKTTQWRTSTDLKNEYKILQVLEHISGARQLRMKFDTPDNQDNGTKED